MKLLSLLPKATQVLWKDIDLILKGYHEENLADDPGEVAHRFIQAFYEAYATATFDNAPRRLEDLQEFILFTSRFENVDALLNEVALLTNLDTESGMQDEDQGDVLKLSTVHQG